MLFLIPISLALLAPRLAAIDGDTNGVSDVWAAAYGATNTAPGDDPDGDGHDNRFESISGTDPFDPLSRFASVATADQTNLWVEWFGVLGKRYEVWYSYNLLDWELFDGPFDGAGMTLSVTDGLPSGGEGEMMMMSAPDPLADALGALAADGVVATWGPYPSWAPNPPPKPPFQLYLVSACALDNGLTSMYFWETTEEGLAHYMVLSSIPLGRLPSPQQWFDEKAGFGAIFMDYPYPWEMYSWYWDIQNPEEVENGLLSSKSFTWTSEPFERFGYRAPSGWVADYLKWMHRYFAENIDLFAEEMIAHEKALAGIEDPVAFELAMAATEQETGGEMMTLAMEPDGIRKFYRVHTIPSLDGDEDGLDAYEEGLLGTLDSSADSDGDGVADGIEFSGGLCPTNSADSDADDMPDDWEIYHFGSLARSTAPTVAWISPTHGAAIAVGTEVYLAASVTETDVVSRVDFFADGTNAGCAVNHPYAVTWSSAAVGAHSLHAVAVFGQGATTGSAPVSVSVFDPFADDDADGLPDAWELEMFGDLSQDGDDDFDGDGFDNLAEYQAGTDPADYFHRPGGPPNLPPIVTMGPDQTIIWPTNSVVLGATAEDPDGGPGPLATLWTVESGPSGVVIANPGATNASATFSQTGDYLFRFEASDGVATRSGLVAAHVTSAAVEPPMVQFIGPADGSTIPMGETLALWVDAADADGDVAEVRLYRNAVLIGALIAPPYVTNWTETALGAVTFSAVAVDDDGNSSTANTTVFAYPGGNPPGGGGSGTPGPSPGKFQQLNVPNPDTGPLEHGTNEFTVITYDEDPVTEQHQIEGAAGEFAILEVVVSSAEYPEYTGDQSKYNDMIQWSVAPAWAASRAGTCSVNTLHNKFDQSPTHEAVVARFLVCFPDGANRTIQFQATVQNVGDGVYDTTVRARMFRVRLEDFGAEESPGETLPTGSAITVAGPILIGGFIILPDNCGNEIAEVRIVQNVAPHVEECLNPSVWPPFTILLTTA